MKEIPERTDNAIKNRFHAIMRALQRAKNMMKKRGNKVHPFNNSSIPYLNKYLNPSDVWSTKIPDAVTDDFLTAWEDMENSKQEQRKHGRSEDMTCSSNSSSSTSTSNSSSSNDNPSHSCSMDDYYPSDAFDDYAYLPTYDAPASEDTRATTPALVVDLPTEQDQCTYNHTDTHTDTEKGVEQFPVHPHPIHQASSLDCVEEFSSIDEDILELFTDVANDTRCTDSVYSNLFSNLVIDTPGVFVDSGVYPIIMPTPRCDNNNSRDCDSNLCAISSPAHKRSKRCNSIQREDVCEQEVGVGFPSGPSELDFTVLDYE